MKHIIKIETLENLPKTRPLIAIDANRNFACKPKLDGTKIWYTTTDNEIYDLKTIIENLGSMGATYNGPMVVSNKYNEEKQMWCMTFDDEVTTLGIDNIDIMAVSGPFFINNSEWGVSCNVNSIILPNSITKIGSLSFYGSYLEDFKINDNVVEIDDIAFGSCNSGEQIGPYQYLGDVFIYLHGDHSLQNVIIREGTKYIEIESIYITNEGPTLIELPSTTKILGHGSIWCGPDAESAALETIRCKAIVPPIVNTDSIGYTKFINLQNIYVPAQSVNAYKSAPGWSEYADRIQAIQ